MSLFKRTLIGSFLMGGPGYVMGQRAFRLLGERLVTNFTSCADTGIEDRDVSYCLKSMGVSIGVSADEQSNLRFVPLNLIEFYIGIYLISIITIYVLQTIFFFTGSQLRYDLRTIYYHSKKVGLFSFLFGFFDKIYQFINSNKRVT